jgi:2-oxoisovalerate dehydrogenase E1 component
MEEVGKAADTATARHSGEMQEHLRLYKFMQTARMFDRLEKEFLARGEAFFSVSCSGHEATACLAAILREDDYLHCHYRDKALLIARGLPIEECFNSLVCNARSHSHGRQMSAHYSARSLNCLSLVGPVGNNALQAVGIAQSIRHRDSNAIVLCSLGDGTTQQGEVLEAIAEAVRSNLRILFLVQDNRYSISTMTAGRTFYSLPSGPASVFYGVPIHRMDGSDVLACQSAFRAVVEALRDGTGPAIAVMAVERLTSHTNADDDTVYRSPIDVQRLRDSADPVTKFRNVLRDAGVNEDCLSAIDANIAADTRAEAEEALRAPRPRAEMSAKKMLANDLLDRQREWLGISSDDGLTMTEALREVLRANMSIDHRINLYGEDIEDPKGDVFGVTRGLTAAFPGRVRNSALSESTIIGTSIGRALAGDRPVAFLQFADFLPLAFNQIATELASLEWRTLGKWRAPVIIMVSCGGYRPGLGPFHSHTFDTTVAHIPGLDVVMPSSAADAAGLLNAAFATERPTVFLYPKALLNDRKRPASRDVSKHWVPIGVARTLCKGDDITLVGWGNTVSICQQVAETIRTFGFTAEVIDLRWLSPWDMDTVCRSVSRTQKLLVVHEDNLTAGFGAEVLARVVESVGVPVRGARVARPDTFIPCHFGNQIEVLPSFRTAMQATAGLLNMEIRWQSNEEQLSNLLSVDLIGSSPSDQTVTVVDIRVKNGDVVKAGDILASLEADKAVIDVASPMGGTVHEIIRAVGESAPVNTPLLVLRLSENRTRQPAAAESSTPHLVRRATTSHWLHSAERRNVVIRGLGCTVGRGALSNAELAPRFPYWRDTSGSDGLFSRTGIESRCVAGDQQDAITMAVEAVKLSLEEARIDVEELSLIICSTSTPTMISPSTACQILHKLSPRLEIAAYDIQAACSGYLFSMANAWDFLHTHPGSNVLLVTTELMRSVVDINDPDTSPIFGDAATATVLSSESRGSPHFAMLSRPYVGAVGENGTALRVPLPREGAFVKMDGRRVFAEAVRRMHDSLVRVCEDAGLSIADLDLVVPHQANGRIIEAMQTRLRLPADRVWNGMRYYGNTSSSSIPLALTSILKEVTDRKRIGLCAFGAGYTFGGAILTR